MADNNVLKSSDHAGGKKIEPIVMRTVESDGRQLIPVNPLMFNPVRDGEFLVVDDESLDLHVFAESKEELISELVDELFYIWDAYAKESPDKLTPKAQELRNALNERFRESA